MDAKDATIVVAEDDEPLREVIICELNRKQFNTIGASNGKEALEIVKSRKVHVVLTDLKMPGGDGIQLLKEIRKMDAHMPVVFMMSGFSDLSPDEAIAMGALKMFEKPFDRKLFISEVIAAVTNIKEDS